MKIAVLGLGFMGAIHLKALVQTPHAEVVAVASDDPRQLSGDLTAVQGNIGGPGGMMNFAGVAKHRDWRQAVADPEVEAVDICLPTHMHAAAAITALKSGKHVLVEKPMALDATSANAMAAAANRNDRILMVAQVLRFFPVYQAMAEQLKSGRLGRVRAASFRRRCAAPFWNPWLIDPKLSGGAVFDLLVHDLDMCMSLFGPPQAVSATGGSETASGLDLIQAVLLYPDFLASVSGGWYPPPSFPLSMEYSITCDGGTIEYHSSAAAPLLYAKGEGQSVLKISGKDGYQAEIEYFVDCCVNGRNPDLCPPAASAEAVKLAALLVQSRDRQGERIPWKSE